MKNVWFVLVLGALLPACQATPVVNVFGRQDIPVSKPDAAPRATPETPADGVNPAGVTSREFPPRQTLPADLELPTDARTSAPATQAATTDRHPVDLADVATLSSHPSHETVFTTMPTSTSQPQSRPAGPARPDEPSPSAPRSKEVFSASALQVNNQYLSIDEIVRSQSDQLKSIPKGVTEEKFRLRAAEILADETRRQVSECLVLKEASLRVTDEVRKKIDADVEQTTRVMAAELGGGSKIRLEQVLIEQGTTLETVLNNYRRRITVSAYMHDKIQASVKVNRTLLWEYYSKHMGEFTQPAKMQMQTIAVPFRHFLPEGVSNPTQAEKDSARKQARERIDQAARDLKAGKSFAEVAQTYSKDAKASDGGLWPLMPAGSFRDAKVEAAAFDLKEGKVSDVLEGESGWYIVKAAQVVPGKTGTFEEAQVDIEKKIREQQERDLTEQYFSKLLENSTVVQYNKFLEMAVNRATERFYNKQ